MDFIQCLLQFAGFFGLGAPQFHLAQRRTQPADADADQPDGLALRADPAEQVKRAAVDLLVLVGWLGLADLARQGGEIGPAQLDPDGGAGHPGLAQASADFGGELAQGAGQRFIVSYVPGKGGLLADGFNGVLGYQQAVIHTAGTPGQVTAVLAEPARQVGRRSAGNVADGLDAVDG